MPTPVSYTHLFTARLATDANGKKLLPKSEAEARAIEKGLEGAEYVVAELKKGKRAKQPTQMCIRDRLHLDDLVTQMGQQLYDGQIAAEPLVAGAGRNPCIWCDYSFICCHETGIGERALEAPAKPFEPEETENEKEGEQA